ncbi:unnamed protein product [Oppiella nova]|uniref:Uncharacterized protein n=1 Tax=Oppiella nova TaxID=334625 RepID=A0A7R9LZK8_9ACAR|nr:unnamed protein product [Oppiella nova]CAG2167880.1 unnamed protein product [Oppiella nova]
MGYRLSDVNFGNINLRNGAYDKYDAYNQSKLCNVLFSRELAKRLQDTNINAYSLHPGAINTDIKRYISSSEGVSRFLLMTPEMGSQTTLYCALDDQLDNESGFHYENCRRVQHMVGQSVDDSIAHKLWELSADLVALETHLTI